MSTTFTPTRAATGTSELASQSLAASATVTATIDVSAHMEKHVQISNTGGGTVAAGATVTASVFAQVGSGPTADTVASPAFQITTVVSTAAIQTIRLQPGRYQVSVKNNDASNAVTVAIQSDSYDLIGT